MPDENGYFGKFGGSFIPPQLEEPFKDIREAYKKLYFQKKALSLIMRVKSTKTLHIINAEQTVSIQPLECLLMS
jgi:tryptophan synthase beta subunit